MSDSEVSSATTTPMWWGVRDPLLVPDAATPMPADKPTLAAEELLKRAVPKTDPIRETPDRWSDSLRATVRDHPLASLLGALAVGALIARITR